MAKLCVTFGQIHTHRVNNETFDCDCVAVITAKTVEEADELAFELFKGKFHQHVDKEKWDEESMHYYPRGYIEAN